MVPWAADAVVMAVDGDNYKLQVVLQGAMGGQSPALPVAVSLPGYSDGVRGRRPPLPKIGTWGTVIFTRGDIRNGRWIGAHAPALVDSASHTAKLADLDHTAHYDGGYSWRGPDGVAAEVWADGSYWLVGVSLPAPTRHTLDANQARQTVPFAATQRRPQTLSPLPISLVQATGAQVSFSAAGSVLVSGAPGQTVTLLANGATVVIDGNGKVTITCAGGQEVDVVGPTVKISNGGTVQAVRLADGSASTVLRAQ